MLHFLISLSALMKRAKRKAMPAHCRMIPGGQLVYASRQKKRKQFSICFPFVLFYVTDDLPDRVFRTGSVNIDPAGCQPGAGICEHITSVEDLGFL